MDSKRQKFRVTALTDLSDCSHLGNMFPTRNVVAAKSYCQTFVYKYFVQD